MKRGKVRARVVAHCGAPDALCRSALVTGLCHVTCPSPEGGEIDPQLDPLIQKR